MKSCFRIVFIKILLYLHFIEIKKALKLSIQKEDEDSNNKKNEFFD